MRDKLMVILSANDKQSRHYMFEDYDNRMMSEIRAFNYTNRTNFNPHEFFLDYLLSEYYEHTE